MKTKWTLPMGITINRHLHDGWDLCVNIRVLGHGSVLTYRVTGYENLYSFKPYFADDISKWVSFYENVSLLIEISAKGPTDSKSSLIQAWCQTGKRLKPEPMVMESISDTSIIRPQ